MKFLDLTALLLMADPNAHAAAVANAAHEQRTLFPQYIPNPREFLK